jgi:hypothetical protein
MSSEAKHSPTPWGFDRMADIEDKEGRELITVTSADGKLICLLGPGNLTGRELEERIANMEFTARACTAHDDLLAACEAVIDAFTCDYIPDTKKANAMLRTRAAIARAQPPASTEG